MRNDVDAGSILYEGKYEGVGPWKSRVFWALRNGIQPTEGEWHLGPKKLGTFIESFVNKLCRLCLSSL